MTLSGTWVPSIACSNVITTSASRSAPRSPRVRRPPAWPAPPFAPPNRFDRMSPKPPASKPPKPPWPRVVLARELAVGLLDVVLGRLAVDAEDAVGVSLGHPSPPYAATTTFAGRNTSSR